MPAYQTMGKTRTKYRWSQISYIRFDIASQALVTASSISTDKTRTATPRGGGTCLRWSDEIGSTVAFDPGGDVTTPRVT
jgi:hypothetical protein